MINETRHTEIDFDVHKCLETARVSTTESHNDILRRLLLSSPAANRQPRYEQQQRDRLASGILTQGMSDLNDVDVHIQVRDDSKVVWVNIDGVCRLRVYNARSVAVDWQEEDNISELSNENML